MEPRSPHPHLWRKLGALLLMAVVAVLAEASYIVLAGLHDRIGHADVALVLGNAVEPDGQPSALLRDRLDKAVERYRSGDFPRIIVSGGYDRRGGDEATAMCRYLLTQGIPAECIILDPHGFNTYASARFTARLMREQGWKSVEVITQYYHVPRARLALSRFGVRTVYSAHARDSTPWDLYHLCREMAGMVTYALRPYGDPGVARPDRSPAT